MSRFQFEVSPSRSALFSCVVLSILPLLWESVSGVGLHKEGNDFCYSHAECGPDSDHWGEICQDGYRQSPISLPSRPHRLPGVTSLHLSSYRGDSFRMQNNGHTVHVEILENGGSFTGFSSGAPGLVIDFPHPTHIRYPPGGGQRAHYKFESAHFHWGVRDDVGSEHCFEDRCFTMELHLVHYLSSFDSMSDALDSGDADALAVIAVMLDATPAAGEGNPVLSPIVNNIFQIIEPSHDDWAYINHPLDLTPLLDTKSQNYMYTYKGSLTTPDCNEQVNWYVFKKPIAISSKDAQAFRNIYDSRGEPLRENHRPIQSRNGRPIFIQAIKAKH